MKSMYRQTCIKRSHLGQRQSGLLRQITSQNSYEIFCDRTSVKDDCLIEVTAWASFDCILIHEKIIELINHNFHKSMKSDTNDKK